MDGPGKKLKLGVNNKEDYAILVATDKWPTKVNGIDIVVQKPKFSPDSFALVVRYVSRELDESFVAGEIQRTIAAADRIKRIHYAYQRKINDFRFDVKDYQEYNAALQLGRIAIGHWLSITQFFPGNRLTYCTKYWCLGHLRNRNRCDAATRCRVCLDTLNDGSTHICKNEPKCAQCGGNHHSLDLVSNLMIKKLLPSYIDCLAKCFNIWLRECRYPDEWELAKIVTLNKRKSGVPKCNQTRPIALLATHSKLFEKVLLQKIRYWAESNHLVPVEQSGFRQKSLLPTRVLSIYQEVKNNMAANLPALAIYFDYQKAYDRVWHAALLFKLWRFDMPLELLKIIESWLKGRKVYVAFGEKTSEVFDINIGLPQCSSLSPYLFIVYHNDLINCLGAHSGHLFADDLGILIRPAIMKNLAPMIQYLENEGTRICNQVYAYSKKWKQPINVSKTVAQLFHTQVKRLVVNVSMNKDKIELVKEFKYLGFTWTDRLSLKSTVEKCIENIQRFLGKLRWLKTGRSMSSKLFRQCFFAYTSPHFA